MRLPTRVILVICLCFGSLFSAEAQQFWERKTPFLDLVYYSKEHEPLSYHVARSFENSLAFHRKLFNWTPSGPVVVLMNDFGDFGHGGTSTVPFNFISVGIEPFDYVYDTAPTNERINWLMHHELVHVVATEKGADGDLTWRKVFHGKVAATKQEPISMYYSFLTSPRWYSPRWYHEGIAVFLETWMAGGVGRALGGYDEMVFRSMVLENAYFYDVVGLESEGTTIDFQVGENSYLYGTRFMTWLAAKYGPEKLIQWIDRSPGSKRYFSAQFQHVYGVPLDAAWQSWIASEHEWQQKNLEMIRKYPVTPETPVVQEGLGSVSRSFFDAERHLLYAAVNRPAKPPQIVSIDTVSGKITPLTEVFGAALYYVSSLAYDPAGRKLFYTTKNTRGWRDINELDLQNGRTRIVSKNGRTGDLVVDPADQSIWGVQHNNGLSALIRMAKPYNETETLLHLDYGRDLFDIDISPDGKMLTGSVIDVSGNQQLVMFDVEKLKQGDTHFELLHEFPDNSPSNFVFSADGRYLYGTSYYTGASNVFRYDFQTKKMDALTNVETGLFRPIPISEKSMIAYRYTSKGFLPVTVAIAPIEDVNAVKYLGQQVVEKFPIVKEWNAGSPARVNLDKVSTYVGPYKARAFRMGSIYPVVEGYKNNIAAGLRLNMSDPFEVNSFDVTAAISTTANLKNEERFHVKAIYDRYPWTVSASLNPTDFYDLFGPTKVSRKGYSTVVSRHDVLTAERPRVLEYTVTGAYYGGLDTLPEYQNIRAPFASYTRLSGHLDFRDLRKTLGGIDDDRGVKWTLAASVNRANSEIFPRIFGTYDRGMLLPLERSSLWIRTAAGKSWGDRDNPFANFYFGGFGNNYVDYQEVHRYAEYYSFPGVALNEIGGSDFGKATIEWQLPPLKFRRVGIPGLYARWARLSLFSQQLVTNVTRDDVRRHVTSAGAQVDVSIVVFSMLDSTLSAGYAVAMEKGRHTNEVMVSLKLLR